MIKSDLDWYLNMMFAPKAEEPKEEITVVETTVEVVATVEPVAAVAAVTPSASVEENVTPVIISEKTAGMPPAVGIACGVVAVGAVICYFIFRKKPTKLDVQK